MTDFDRTLTSGYMQDEHAQQPRTTFWASTNENSFAKVKEALVNAFAAPVPVLA